jgi:N-hydroxyarylamine O-acetyltransferase
MTNTDSSAPSHLDLDAYLRRIGYRGDLTPNRAILNDLHLAHATSIPFENLDVLIKRPIRLDLASLQAKLVHAGRGGYCFEQNGLFSAVLRRVGFNVTSLAARVRYRTTQTLPRTHMTLLVQADNERFLADVGFGSAGLLLPISIDSSEESQQFAWKYRIIITGSFRTLQIYEEESWTDLYTFSLEPQEQADYEMANYYVSTNPESRFVQILTVQKISPEERHTLRDREYSISRGTTVETRQITGADDYCKLLAQTFGLQLPDGFRYGD